MNLWLGKRRNGSIDLIDGMHDEPEGVAKAAALHDIIYGEDAGPFVMVEISDVPTKLTLGHSARAVNLMVQADTHDRSLRAVPPLRRGYGCYCPGPDTCAGPPCVSGGTT